MVNTVDLHAHSTASDGVYSPTILLEQAKSVGLRTLALTDHDSTEGIDEAAQAAKSLNIELIPGVEINTDIQGSEVHVLGYFVEYQGSIFQSVLKTLRDARERRGQRIVELLREQSVMIDWERVRQIAQGTVGRPHVAKALLEAGYVQTLGEAFNRYIGKGCPAYVPHSKLTPKDAVEFITKANGLPVLAHPLELPGLSKLPVWLPDLCEAGLIGLETYYGPYTEDDEQKLLALATEYQLIPTGGSDFHGPGIHPTPLGGRSVPYESVERLKAEALQRRSHR